MNFTTNKVDTIQDTNRIVFLKLENDNTIQVLKRNHKSLILESYDSNHFHFINYVEFQTGDIDLERVHDFQFLSEIEKFCICFGEAAVIYNKDGSTFLSHKYEDDIISSHYVNHQTIYLELFNVYGNKELGVWNIETNKIKSFELECYDHYNRNFKIENTSTILYGTANAYWSGVHLHILNTENDNLYHINEKDLSCGRSEIECYAISINSIGDEFIIISENDNGKIPILCYYSVFNQSKPIAEFTLYDDSNILSNFLDTSFLIDELLLVVSQTQIGLLDPNNELNKKKSTFELFDRDHGSCYSINNRKGQFIYMKDKEIYLSAINKIASEISDKRKGKMDGFLSDVKNQMFQVKQVGTM